MFHKSLFAETNNSRLMPKIKLFVCEGKPLLTVISVLLPELPCTISGSGNKFEEQI